MNLLLTPDLPPTPSSNHPFTTRPTTHTNITDALLRALPSQKDIKILLGEIPKSPTFHYQSNFSACNPSKRVAQNETSPPNLLHPQSHPVLLAKQMIRFAAALQCIPPNESIPGLAQHHHVTMQELADAAINLVNTNDALLGTLEGLENIIFEALYHIDGGNIRRSWITMRRAVMAGQLLGLHRSNHHRFKVINDKNELDPGAMWTCIVTMERVLSLLLGLPTSTGYPSFEALETSRTRMEMLNLPTLLSSVTAKILERNQINVSQQALDMTQEIDRELIKMTEKLPSEFWQPLALSSLGNDSMDAAREIRLAWDQMWYYTLVNQLHLPYLMSPNHASQMVYSQIACVNASREVLSRQITVRTLNQNTACSRMGDFLALIAGMTLMLAHAVSHCQKPQKPSDSPLTHQRLSDRATVQRALDCMNSMSGLHEDVLAVKCASLLKDLLAIEAAAAEGKRQGTDGGGEDKHSTLVITVPYIGAVSIGRDGVKSLVPAEAEQDHGLGEGVTIGGIGCMYLNGPMLPGHGTGDVRSDAGVAVEARVMDGDTENAAPVQSGGLLTQQDQMFPDAAAPLGDWVFQGFDTAFFDVLMREQLDDNAAGWNF